MRIARRSVDGVFTLDAGVRRDQAVLDRLPQDAGRDLMRELDGPGPDATVGQIRDERSKVLPPDGRDGHRAEGRFQVQPVLGLVRRPGTRTQVHGRGQELLGVGAERDSPERGVDVGASDLRCLDRREELLGFPLQAEGSNALSPPGIAPASLPSTGWCLANPGH